MSLDRLLEVYEKLGPIERKVLCTFANRIHAGQRKYGPVTAGKKVWTWEAFEEALDASVYLACGLMDATEESRRKYRAELDGLHPTVVEDMKANPQFYGDVSALEGPGS